MAGTGDASRNNKSRASTTVMRRQLGRKLRAMREATGRSRDDVVASRLMSRSKLESIEHGRTMVRPGDAYELGRIYGASPEELETLREMAVATNQTSWWQGYSADLTRGFETYLDLEACARQLWIYEPAVVHGLVQTEEYALAVDHAVAGPGADEALIRNFVELRMTRQRIVWDREPPVRVHLVLGEAALRLRVGDPEVMAGQRERLRQEGERENLDLRVLTDEAGPHRGLRGGFAVLDFEDPENPSVVHTESRLRARFDDREADVAHHREVYQEIHDKATPLKEYLA
jgi:transcriptional regulator with XRE-family HTH domain